MKICHLTSVHTHTDIRVFYKECRSLAQAGYEVHYVVPGTEDALIDGIHLHGVTEEKGSRFRRMTKTVDRVYKKAIQIDAQIYHFHDPELIPIGLKLKKLGKKVIYDIHEDMPRAIMSKYWIPVIIRKPVAAVFEAYENYSAKKFDFLITATPYITKRFNNINPNTINVNNFPLLNEFAGSRADVELTKTNSVCYIGVISHIRGVKQVLEAANYIKGTIEFAGRVGSEDILEILHSQKNVQYHGTLNRGEVKSVLSRSVAGIVTFLPEPNHIHSQPNKMFEYMSAGIPVICSNFPKWKEIIEKHKCGICVDPNDSQAIADAINYFLTNPETAALLGKNGQKAIKAEYNWEAESRHLISIYEKLSAD
ncbi:glycosyltransferase family 4 protein [Bacillus sp. DTU_2020_1000418_1_SI_GHA_SEK_038]|uniref:glycosyltransferase family 4 protein n=1 Tax=Bacillus sp. DTU_2020_1000418_1_SI_GHA_SEK_038 TaxID=3077585 RepID=UPI0028EB8602|nr:glycosyltransferase family 4 protein [Bacillus sp. DTU_2020_1000418_1_SI_GHA_SEK_038]WNS74822.1 glycosyltransferase family 4 protein [Bacillus sp. DTU_2020_1000418_1_SI_GHA_SEK_038]